MITPVTTEVENARILGERGIYLGTRLPLIAGSFMDLWTSEILNNVDAKKILNDINQFVQISDRLSISVEKLPDHLTAERSAAVAQIRSEADKLSKALVDRFMKQLTNERKAAINQVADKIAYERKQLIKDFNSKENQIRDILKELNDTLQSGTGLIEQTNLLMEQVNPGKAGSIPSEPFDITEYKEIIQEAAIVFDKMNEFMKHLDKLVIAPGWDKTMKRIIMTVDRIGLESDERISHFFLLGFVFIACFLIGQLLILLIYRYVSVKYFFVKDL